MIRVKYMEDNLVLLTPKEGEQMEDLIKLNKEWFESVFEVIDPCQNPMYQARKLYGLDAMVYPFHCGIRIAYQKWLEKWSLWYLLMKLRDHGIVSSMQESKCTCLTLAKHSCRRVYGSMSKYNISIDEEISN